MRIAIFLEIINFEHLNRYILRVYLFDVKDTVIVAIGNELLSLANENYLITWLLGEGVQSVYAHSLPDSVLSLMERAGISVSSLDKIRENPLMHSVLFRTAK